jgi:protein TonB
MGIVAGMHVAAFYMIARSLGIIQAVPPDIPIQTTFEEQRTTREDPPPRTDPAPARNIVILPEPDPLPQDPPASEDGITAKFAPADHIPLIGPGTADPEPKFIAARQDARHPLSQPPYPPTDIRMGNEGNADVEVYVLPNGRVGDARIVRSTGYERLDKSALDEAKRNWRLVPATRDGQPVAQWYKVRVTFKLTTQ